MSILLYLPNKTSGIVKHVRFRVRCGRDTNLWYRSDLTCKVADLLAFDTTGRPKNRFGMYNHELADQIDSTMTRLNAIYEEMALEGAPMTSEEITHRMNLEKELSNLDPYNGNVADAYAHYYNTRLERGYITPRTMKNAKTITTSLKGYLRYKRMPNCKACDFRPEDVLQLYDFIVNEYRYMDEYPDIYKVRRRKLYTKRTRNTVATMLHSLSSFFEAMESQGYITISPFRKIPKDEYKNMSKQQYDEPVFLTEEEFRKVAYSELPDKLVPARDSFVLQCMLGCRISDFQKLNRDMICVSPDGVPYFRYVPQKTAGRSHIDVETPLLKMALEILKKYDYVPPLINLRNKDHYNNGIRSTLKYLGIDKPCKVWDEKTKQNILVPIYQLASSKLSRKTHEDIMVKVQINMYTTGLHKVGSNAIKAYTSLTLMDRYKMMCMAFGQPEYRVDRELNIIEG